MTTFLLYDPAFGDSDDEDMHLNYALGEDMDEVEIILHGNAGILGDCKELAVLPDKIASYLYEYHADSYASHGLPPLPADRSDTDVHGILKALQVVPICC